MPSGVGRVSFDREEAAAIKGFFSSRKFLIIACIAAFLIGIMIYAAVSSSNAITSAVGTVFAPLQKFSNNISDAVTETIDMLINARDYYEENIRLKEEVAALLDQMSDYTEVMQENDHLREMIDLSQSSDGIVLSEPCTVIGRTANDIYGSFFIDMGSKDGIEYYDPVVTASGLVGFVTEVEYTYSKVTTILSNDISLGVYCVRTGETGVIEGNYELALDQKIRMVYIPLETKMQSGDIVITSGYSGLVPQGLVVGTADETFIAPNGLSRSGLITPAIDPFDLKTVFVITDFDGKGSGYEEK